MNSAKFSLLAFFLPAVLTGQTIRMYTNVGNIDVILTPNVAPATVANFLNYMNTGAYTNTIFHRSVPGFVIQAGGYQANSGYSLGSSVTTTPTNAPVTNEFTGVSNTTGTIAMAQPSTSPNGATSQWFFNLTNNGSSLDSQMSGSGPYVVFGRIANSAGLTIMSRIGALIPADESSLYGSAFTTTPLSGGNLVVVQSMALLPSLTAPGFQSAASFASSSLTGISPGELIVIYGQSLGPAALSTLTINNGTAVNSLAGTQVFFNTTPAPIIYTSAGQVSVVAPYNIANFDTIDVTVTYQGVASNALVFPVQPANPAIFTLNSSGTGDAAIVRYSDGAIITATNPAQAGDVLILYGEGYGVPTDATKLADGAIVGTKLPVVADPTTLLLIDGQPVTTSYFGGTPTLINGVLQVNFTVPQLSPGGHNIQLQVGSRKSPNGVNLQTK